MRSNDQHTRFRELIAARLDRPLSRMELRSLNAHLKSCASCRGVEADYRAQRALLRALPQPFPPRDLWARTSASLDREVARGYRASRWSRRLARATRSNQPSTGVMTAVAALGAVAALAVLQLAPAFAPQAAVPGQPTPLAVVPQPLAIIGLGASDISVYRTSVSQVCPATAPIDCVETDKVFRAPLGLPASMRAGNIALSPSGQQLALVSHYTGHDVISVVTMPSDSGASDPVIVGAVPTEASGQSEAPGSQPSTAASSGPLTPADSGDTGATQQPSQGPVEPTQPVDGNATPIAVADASLAPSLPPASAIPGLAVLNILEDVESVGAPPAWSAKGSMLAFSAMPVDGSSGPDVYLWSPGDEKARAITSDHGSFFASWSGNRVVLSRLGGADGRRARTFVIDPQSLDERAVSGLSVWLPVVNAARTEAVAWFGQLDVVDDLPTTRSGALYLFDWSLVDPYGSAEQQNPGNAVPPEAPPTEQPPTTPPETAEPTTPASEGGNASDSDSDSTPAPDATAATEATADPDATVAPEASTAPDGSPEPDQNTSPTDSPAANQVASPTAAPTAVVDEGLADAVNLVALEPSRDAGSAPVLDWQARWSNDGQVLGVWVADSAGSSWGRLAVFAVDSQTERVQTSSPLLAPTLARRGFSLGISRVAWVGPSDENVDGELRIRTWGDDGVGGLRLRAPGQEELLPAF